MKTSQVSRQHINFCRKYFAGHQLVPKKLFSTSTSDGSRNFMCSNVLRLGFLLKILATEPTSVRPSIWTNRYKELA